MVHHMLSALKGAAIGEISRDARAPKGVIANGGFDPGRAAKLAYPKAPGSHVLRVPVPIDEETSIGHALLRASRFLRSSSKASRNKSAMWRAALPVPLVIWRRQEKPLATTRVPGGAVRKAGSSERPAIA